MKDRPVLAGYCGGGELSGIAREDVCMLTHINVAVGSVSEGKAAVLWDAREEDMERLRAWNPELKLCVSFSGDFSGACGGEAEIKRLAKEMAELTRTGGFDGVNLDWGNPCSNVNGAKGCPEDKQKHTALCREIRSALNRQPGRTPLFTVAAGFDRCFPDSTRMDLVQEWVDLVFVETFDMRGPFQVLTGHHTNLYLPTGDIFSTGINISVENLFAAGVPKEKLVVGMSFHSQKWEGVPNRYNGFLQIAGTRGVRGPGYEELCRDYVGKNGFVRYWDTEGKAPYLFDGKTFLSYEDEESVEHKCGYVTTQGLGGLFWREPERDMSPKLLAAAFRGLTQSCLERKG